MFKTMHKLQIMIGAVAVSMVCSSCFALTMKSAPDMGLFKKKKKTVEQPVSDYKKLVGSDSVNVKGVMNVVKKDQDFYLEMPVKLMGRVFLVSNKLQRVPNELNEAGVNRGINYENQCVRFEWDKKKKTVFVRQQRVTPEVDQKDAMAASVENNYIDPLIASLKVEAVANDSSTVIFKVNDLFNGKKTYFNDVFNLINLGTSADSDLSHIIDIKAFSNNVTATSELTTVVHEGKSKTNVTVEVSCSLVLLPEQPMVARKENQRVGYFTTSRLQYGDRQQEVTRNNYITRWRLEPTDEEAYLRGELVEPKKPIVFYIDQAVPAFLRPYIKRGMTDWNVAFEKAGFKTMLYANLMWKFFVFTPELLNRYDMWFAQYAKKPTSPYKFTFWQYSGGTKIDGVEKPCDMNVWFVPLEDETEAENSQTVSDDARQAAGEFQIELQETEGSLL